MWFSLEIPDGGTLLLIMGVVGLWIAAEFIIFLRDRPKCRVHKKHVSS